MVEEITNFNSNALIDSMQKVEVNFKHSPEFGTNLLYFDYGTVFEDVKLIQIKTVDEHGNEEEILEIPGYKKEVHGHLSKDNTKIKYYLNNAAKVQKDRYLIDTITLFDKSYNSFNIYHRSNELKTFFKENEN